MIVNPAKRTSSVQEYYFSRKLKEIAGMDSVINLGIGSPDGMPPAEAIEALSECAREKGSHGYQSYTGTPELRRAFADFYRRYYSVRLDPDTQIQPLMGSKEGVLLINMAFVDEGDKVLVPDPGYPTYTSASALVGAQIIKYDLLEDRRWMPDFEALEKMDLSGVKVMWMNYPNMPTGANASRELYERAVSFALKHKILLVNDNPYSFILNDNPLSIFCVPEAKECCLELNSLSKAHNMAGWRIGMVCGDKALISEVLKVKSQMDSGMLRPLQMAAVEALSQGPEWFRALNDEYALRRKAACSLYDRLNLEYDPSSSGLFLWGRVGEDNPLLYGDLSKSLGERLSDTLLYKAGVFLTPGFIFGDNGRNYIRASLCATAPVLRQAEERIGALL